MAVLVALFGLRWMFVCREDVECKLAADYGCSIIMSVSDCGIS